MKRIALIVHRYDKTIGSGAENLAMMYAQHLKNRFVVEVLTTTCLDTDSWSNALPQGQEEIDGIIVHRFPTVHGRDQKNFPTLSILQADCIARGEPTEYQQDQQWIEAQGPDCPEMLEYLDLHREDYDAFVFFTYLYYPSVRGIPRVAEKAIFIPTAHDEIWIRQGIFQELFSMPVCFGFLTEDEQNFVYQHFHNEYIPSSIVGCGIEVPKTKCEVEFRKKFHVEGDYLLYVGRIEKSKGCDELLSHFIQYKKEYPTDLKLVLMGRGDLEIPNRADIIATGFVSEQEKWDGIAGAKVILAPSPAESLCIALLEGLGAGIPALVNGNCTVLRNHCVRGACGYSYTDYATFQRGLSELLEDHLLWEELGSNGAQYVKSEYTWNVVTERLKGLIDFVEHGDRKKLIEQSQPTKGSVKKQRGEFIGRNIFEDYQLLPELIHAEPNTALEPVFSDVTVLFVASDNFTSRLGVLIQSILVNGNCNRKYELVVLQNDMTVDSMNKIYHIVECFGNAVVRFVDVNDIVDESSLIVTGENYNHYAFYRLLLPHLMRKYEKVLYLDADILANADIAELYDTDMTDYALAGTYDITVTSWLSYKNQMRDYFHSIGLKTPAQYLQAGVIVFNVEKMNQMFSPEFLIQKACTEKYVLNDQDLLNVYCKDKIRFLPLDWNVFVLSQAAAKENEKHLPEVFYREYTKARNHPKLIHYTEKQFPDWKPGSDLGSYYWKYARETPFYEEMMLQYIQQQA